MKYPRIIVFSAKLPSGALHCFALDLSIQIEPIAAFRGPGAQQQTQDWLEANRPGEVVEWRDEK